MGYDMRWEAVPDEVVEAISEADAKVKAARESTEQDGEKKQAALSAAWDEYWRADRSYFRLNIWGMSTCREVMVPARMLWIDGDAPPFPPKPEGAGDDWYDSEESQRGTEYVKTFHPEGAIGIPWWKLSSNDGWLVTPEECRSALAAWYENGEAKLKAEIPDWWQDWLRYLEEAAAHGGFRVW